jgi:hypothetical protein
MLPAMAAVRLTAALLVVIATAVTGQNTSTTQVVITVVDPTGAVIPGAHIGIIPLPASVRSDGDWLDYARTGAKEASTKTDRSGEATISLAKGSYAITITSPGFERHAERIDLADESGRSLRETLLIDSRPTGPVVTPQFVIPLEPTSLDALIPLDPLQTITFTHRVRRRWFF